MSDSTRLFGTKTIGNWKEIRQKIIENPDNANHWKDATDCLMNDLKQDIFDQSKEY